MVNEVNFTQIVDQLSVVPKTSVTWRILDVRQNTIASINQNLWKEYEDSILQIPLPQYILDKLEKYGDSEYWKSVRFSGLELRSKAALIEYLKQRYNSLLKKEASIETWYSASLIENLTEQELMREQSGSEVNKINKVRAEYKLLKLLKSLFTGVPLEKNSSY